MKASLRPKFYLVFSVIHFISVDYTGTTREIVAEWVQRTPKHSEVRILLPHNALQTDLNIFTTTGRHVISMDIQGEETRNFFPWCATFQPTRNMKKNIHHFEQYYHPVNGIGNLKGIRSLYSQSQNQKEAWVCRSNVAAEATYYRFVQQAQKRMRDSALAALKSPTATTTPNPHLQPSKIPLPKDTALHPCVPPHTHSGAQMQMPPQAIQSLQGLSATPATPAYLPSHYPQQGVEQNWMVGWPQPTASHGEQSLYAPPANYPQATEQSAFRPYNPPLNVDNHPLTQNTATPQQRSAESRDILRELGRKQHMEMIAKKLAQPLQKRKASATISNPENMEVLATFGPGEAKSSRTTGTDETLEEVSTHSPRSRSQPRRKPRPAHIHRRLAPSTNTGMPPPAHQTARLPNRQAPQLAGLLAEKEDSQQAHCLTDGEDRAVPLLAQPKDTLARDTVTSPFINVVDSEEEEDEAFQTADDTSTVSTKVKHHSATAPKLGISVGQAIEENPPPTHHQAIAQYSLVAPLSNLQMVQLSNIRNVRTIPQDSRNLKQRPPTPVPNRINIKPVKSTPSSRNLWEDLGRKLKINIPALGFKGTATVKENKSLRVCVPSKEKARADTHLGRLHTLVQDIPPAPAPTPINSPNTPIHIE